MNQQLTVHAQGFLLGAVRLAVWLALLVAVFVPLEWLCALHPAKLWRKQIGVDLGWYFVNSLLPAVVLSLPLALASQALHAWDPGGFYSAVAAWPFWLKLLLVLFVSDLGAYWGHRAMHSHHLLWRFHALHHSAEELDWLVNTRAHPFDTVFVRFAGLAPVYLLGIAQTAGPRIDPAVAILTIFGTAWTFFIHANITVRLGPLEWLISSPAFHHWHHTRDQYRDRNFAFVFPCIDRVFGTAWLPKYWPSAYGVNAKLPETMIEQFFEPFEPARRTGSEKAARPEPPGSVSPDQPALRNASS